MELHVPALFLWQIVQLCCLLALSDSRKSQVKRDCLVNGVGNLIRTTATPKTSSRTGDSPMLTTTEYVFMLMHPSCVSKRINAENNRLYIFCFHLFLLLVCARVHVYIDKSFHWDFVLRSKARDNSPQAVASSVSTANPSPHRCHNGQLVDGRTSVYFFVYSPPRFMDGHNSQMSSRVGRLHRGADFRCLHSGQHSFHRDHKSKGFQLVFPQ